MNQPPGRRYSDSDTSLDQCSDYMFLQVSFFIVLFVFEQYLVIC